MLLIMHKAATVFVCLAYLGYGRRLQSLSEQFEAHRPVKTEKLLKANSQRSAKARPDPPAALAKLLVQADPAAAFHASAPAAFRRSHRHYLDRACGFSRCVPLIGMTEEVALVENKTVAKEKKRNIKFDNRGFLVPNLGDLVKYPGKWQEDFNVGLVDFVQKVGSVQGINDTRRVEAELIPLKEVGELEYKIPFNRKSKDIIRFDIGKLGRLKYEYDEKADVYLIAKGQKTVFKPKPPDPEKLALGIARYEELKADLLKTAGLVGAVCTALAVPLYGPDTAFSFGSGALASIIYLILLEGKTDAFGGGATGVGLLLASPLVALRLLFPVIAFGLVAAKNVYLNGDLGMSEFPFNVIPKEQIPPLVLGLLTYKAGLLVQSTRVAYDTMLQQTDDDELPSGSDMSQYSASRFILRQVGKAVRESAKADAATETAAAAAEGAGGQIVAICGPSDETKRQFIGKLFEESPDKYAFPVAYTTREPLQNEINGTDFIFVDEEKFTAMVAGNRFLEYTKVGKTRYGNAIDSVEEVYKDGKIALIELDVRDIPAVKERSDLSTFAAWVPPENYQGNTEMKSLAEESGYFDQMLDNTDSDAAFSKLQKAIEDRF